MKRIINVVGARPNFMKVAPIMEEMGKYPMLDPLLVHTGQHYDALMSKVFFEDLGMPKPDIFLGIGSGSHAEQTARIMVEFEKVCLEKKPDLVLVVGDVNSTMACTITAKKMGIRVAHVEAGLRSRDMEMPEEINRLCTDVLSDFLFTTDILADKNLVAEGISKDKIFFVGNVMIDTLIKHKERASHLTILQEWGLAAGDYAVLTLHRPSNVDQKEVLEEILEALAQISTEIPIIFPIHPRTSKMISDFQLDHFLSKCLPVRGIWLTDPLGYLEFLHLNINARMVLTDSGGLQEETTYLGIPCVTLRHNTERPVTCELGTNFLVGNKKADILKVAEQILCGTARAGCIPEKWDGQASERIVRILMEKI